MRVQHATSRLFRLCLVLTLGLGAPAVVLVPGDAAAYGHSSNRGYGQGNRGTGRTQRNDPREAGRIAAWIDDAWGLCQTLPASYQTDCLAGEYRAISARLPRNGAFTAQTRAALATAVRGLEAAARPARDRSQPVIRRNVPAQSGVRARRTAPIEPVRAAIAAQVNARAAQVITTAGVQLLRSVPDNDPRADSFQQIAAAFGETAVLLRS